MIEFELIDDTQELNVELEDNTQNVEFNLTDYDDSEIKEEISNVDNRVDELGYYVDTQIDGLNDEINGLSNQVGTNTTQIAQNKADITTLNNRVDQIPIITKTSQITNDSGFIEDNNYIHTDNNYTTNEKNKLAGLNNYDDTEIKQDISNLQTNKADRTEIPDVSNFITKTVDDLVNYYKKSETYNKNEVNNLIGQISTISIQIVEQLPAIGESNIIYLVPKTASTNDIYDEYIYISNAWEHIGSTEVDLTNYYTKQEVNQLLANINIPTALSQLTDDSTHRLVTDTEKATWNGKQNAITSSNKLLSDLVDDTNQTNKFVTTTEKTTWNNKADAETIVEITPVDGVVNLGTTSASNIYYINSPIHSLTAIVNNGENEHTRIIFTADNQITEENPFTLSLTNTNNNLYFDNGAIPKPVINETWVFDIVKNRCIATMYKENYMGWDRDEQILFLIRSNSNQIYYPSLDSKPSITLQSAKGSTDPGRPVVMEYSEPVLTSYQNVEYYGIPKFIPLDLSLYDSSTQANQLHPYTQLPDGNYWVKNPGRMYVAGESYSLVGKELIYKKGNVLGINGGEYTAAYYAWDSTEGDYKGGFFTTYQDVMDAIAEINYEPGLTVVRQTTTSGTTTVNNGKWNKRTNPVNSMTLAMANLTEIPDTFKARVTVQTSATFTSFSISQRTAFKVYFAGWDCSNGVLAGKPNAFYNIDYRADGRGNIIAMVTGYDVPTT